MLTYQKKSFVLCSLISLFMGRLQRKSFFCLKGKKNENSVRVLLEKTSSSEVRWPLMIRFGCHGNGEFFSSRFICSTFAFYSTLFIRLVLYWQFYAS